MEAGHWLCTGTGAAVRWRDSCDLGWVEPQHGCFRVVALVGLDLVPHAARLHLQRHQVRDPLRAPPLHLHSLRGHQRGRGRCCLGRLELGGRRCAFGGGSDAACAEADKQLEGLAWEERISHRQGLHHGAIRVHTACRDANREVKCTIMQRARTVQRTVSENIVVDGNRREIHGCSARRLTHEQRR